MLTKIIKFLATGCYAGLLPFAPGTFGSLLAFPLLVILLNILDKLALFNNISEFLPLLGQLQNIFIMVMGIWLILTLIAAFIVYLYLKQLPTHNRANADPKEVVIDEIIGQMLTSILSSLTMLLIPGSKIFNYFSHSWLDFSLLILLPFITFRFFDIVKPWPISWFDQHVHGAAGIMLDDIIAAIFAALTCHTLTFMLISFN